MNTINKRILSIVITASVFLTFTIVLMYSMMTNAREYALKSVNGHLYDNGILVNAGDIVDRNGIILATTQNGERVYNEDSDIRKSFLHIIGDNKGFISGGIQDTFDSELSGYNIIYGVNKESTNRLNLTLDAQLCAYAYNELRPYKGCIAVCNYQTGEILCIATSPTYDVYNKPDNIDTDYDFDGVYINRFFGGLYTPGSIFKTVTAMSAIENIYDIFTRTFYCNGSYEENGVKIICNDTHGEVTFEQALNQSCNVAFAQIAIELGSEKLSEAFSEAGLGSSVTTPDRITTTAGRTDISSQTSANDLGWAGIGQHTTLVNPYSVLTYICAVANGGKCYEPYFVKSATNENNRAVYKAEPVESAVTINPSTASTLDKMLRSTVSDYYGDYRFGELTMCGKTGTAEKDDKNPTAWFIGYSQDDSFPYAVVAVLEESGSGLKYAGTAASNVMQKAYSKYK